MLAREHALLREAQLARDAEHGGLADRLGESLAPSGAPRPHFTARTTRSTPRTASSFAAPRAPTSAAFAAARSASREPMTTSSPASASRSREREPEVAGSADDRDLHAGTAPSAASASRRRASASDISVRVTIGANVAEAVERARIRLVDDERVDQPRVAAGHVRGDVPPASRASMRSAGPLTARPPISGLTATHGTRPLRERSRVSACDRENRRDRDVRIARRDERAARRRRSPRARPAPAPHCRRLRSARHRPRRGDRARRTTPGT